LKGLFGKDRVCGVVAAATAGEMRLEVRLGLRETRTLELRLDYLRSAKEREELLSWLGRNCPRAVLIATCRRKEGGGLFQGSREEQIEILAQAARCGCDWCDVEIETAKHVARDKLTRALSPARVMVSYHDFRRTPRSLKGIVRQLEGAGGQAIKIAAQCNSVSDSVRICELARGRRDAVVIPMGEFGLAGRVLSLHMGSALAYAAVEQATAPGQLSLDAMTGLYRAAQITRRTRVYGVIGDPIGHSLSPLLHNTAFRTRQFDAVFVPFLVRNLREFLGAMEGFGVAGLSVTIPHKETILRSLDDCDPLAERIGAVNTVVVRGGGRLYGYNTDYVGVLRSLEKRMRLAGSRVLLIAVWRGRRSESGRFRAGAGGLDRLHLRAATGTGSRAGTRRRRPGRGARRSEA
jgi:3-dehydroquinate dehydratase/shikimate dehydrogenase